eukprot:m.485641 g.485641  ORF g.485641 m.485641 type:complete len:901 (+) comp23895_c0_seq1:278-2980(+)
MEVPRLVVLLALSLFLVLVAGSPVLEGFRSRPVPRHGIEHSPRHHGMVSLTASEAALAAASAVSVRNRFVGAKMLPVDLCNTSSVPGGHITGGCSNLLSPGVTSITFNISTSANTACRFASSNSTPYNTMTPFDSGDGTKFHKTKVTGLSANSSKVNHVYVRCEQFPGELLHLVFRALAAVKPGYPRIGNLWGSYVFKRKGLEYASRIDLWLGASWDAEELETLRALNPATLALTSINSCEFGDGLPDSFYLHNASNRARLESWPGAYRLDLTRPEVSFWKAKNMYELILRGGGEDRPSSAPELLPFDGVFVDNVFLTQSWANHDIHGNPFYPDTTGDGKPDDPKEFDAKWRAGVLLELDVFRSIMPNAIMSGHAMDPSDSGITSVFNAISIGFTLPYVLDGRRSFDDAWAQYEAWMHVPIKPHITMQEGGPPLQLGYGYGFDSQLTKGSIPASTLEFARDYFRYMRFGLGFTLLDDGYFAYELGDSWHGQDWNYDEFRFDLGDPVGPAFSVSDDHVGQGHVQLPTQDWQLWVSSTASANLTWDTQDKHSDTPSARIDVYKVGKTAGGIDLFHPDVTFTKGQDYAISFWAKARNCASSAPVVELNSRKNGPDWHPFGLQQTLWVSCEWSAYKVAFVATDGGPDEQARVSFWLGDLQANQTLWIDNVTITKSQGVVYQRTFTKGLVLVNARKDRQTVSIPTKYRRFLGQGQAPRHQYIVDDADNTSFAAASWSRVSIEGGYDLAHPSSEEDSGPYFHQWATSARQLSVPSDGEAGAASPAEWQLGVTESDQYNVSVWWPASPAASGWCTHARFAVLQNSTEIHTATLDQSTNGPGGDQWALAAQGVSLSAGATATLTCPASCTCIADALLISSRRRFNDGSDLNGSVTLDANDAILLQATS